MRRTLHLLLDAWATALAVFALAGVVRGLFPGGRDWTWMWIQGGPRMPRPVLALLILVFAAGVLVRRPRLVTLARGAALLLALVALVDTAQTLRAHMHPYRARLGFPIPESLLTAGLLLLHATLGPAAWPRVPRLALRRAVLVAGMGVLCLLGHMAVVGATGRRDPGTDAIVVLGAKVRADGRPSGALEDRVAAAIDLFHQTSLKGDPVLVLSGGTSPGAPVSEPEAMARFCRARGIPEDRLILDLEGATTQESARSVRRLAEEHGWRRLHVVSHDYHLARVQVAFRQAGLRAYTVPCDETHAWPQKPLAILREVVALGAYLLRGAP